MTKISSLYDAMQQGAIVLTPTRRLAESLTKAYDQHYLSSYDTKAFSRAKILSFQDWLGSIWQEGYLAGWTNKVLLSSQSALFWMEKIIKQSAYGQSLLRYHSAAKLALSAWHILHQWQQSHLIASEFTEYDHLAFKEFCSTYLETLQKRGMIDSTQLLGVIIDWIPQYTKPVQQLFNSHHIICFGFDDMPPQVASLFEELQLNGWEVQHQQPDLIHPKQIGKLSCETIREEMQMAAKWAKQLVESGVHQRIAIVLPDLPQHREEVFEVFSLAYSPHYFLQGETTVNPLFNISTAVPLNLYPVVQTVMSLLGLMTSKMRIEDWMACLQSPFIQGGITQPLTRQQLISQLRLLQEEFITLPALQKWGYEILADDDSLTTLLSNLNEFHRLVFNTIQPPFAWPVKNR